MPETNYGYKDGAGTWYITVDTGVCDGCNECVEVCPAEMWELAEDEFAIMGGGDQVAQIKQDHRKSVRYDCSPCKSPSGDDDSTGKCVETCHVDAIEMSW